MGIAFGVAIGANASDQPTTTTATTIRPKTEIVSPTETAAPAPVADPTQPTTAPSELTPTGPVSDVNAPSGSGPRQSALFDLPAGDVTLHFDSSGGTLTVRLFAQDATGNGDTFTCTEACDKQAAVTKEAGRYYLDVESTNSNWNVLVGR